MSPSVFVGIDVSQAQLDVAVRPSARFSATNDERGIGTVVEHLHTLTPTLIVLEATGGVELPLVGTLAAAGLSVVVVNPRQVRNFAKATGKLAKTDALDARILTQFGEVLRPARRPLPDAHTQALTALVTRRRQVIEMLTAEKTRLRMASASIRQSLRAHIAWLERELVHTDADLAQTIRQSPIWRDKVIRCGVCRGWGQSSPRPCWLSCLNWAC